ncbi:tripartite tricarboxylate transporter TctB family protein [Frigidibacter sp. MR17.14]|uniref:tripartite tricarboxylate transporter TctB family protein n=1 Tax=Frigidibacter sp. MR17.14 TaxID=3126509 RepID=UPI003012F982
MTQLPQDSRRRPDRPALLIAAGLAGMGAVVLWDVQRLKGAAGYSQVGPATIPQVVGAGLLILALWTVVAAWRGDFPERDKQQFGPVVWVVAGLAGQLLLLNVAGFSIATGILFGLTARGFGQRNLPLALGVGVVLSFIVWVIFSQLLMLHLPVGPLERLVGG